MINTVNIKSEQLTNGYFETGSGQEKVLVMGSCRVAPYLNYLHRVNEALGNRFTIYSLDPFNWNWNDRDERVDYDSTLFKLEQHQGLLNMLSSVDYFFHEYYQNAGMFNVRKGAWKTIYDFGMNPKVDVCIPSWNDVFVLFKDIITFDTEISKKAHQDWNVLGKLSEQLQEEMFVLSQKALQKFYMVCGLSDIPEMAAIFIDNLKEKRFFHTYNHVSKNFTMEIFNILCEKYLNVELPKDFYDDQPDIFANSFTPLTEYDIKFHGYGWQNEEIKSIL